MKKQILMQTCVVLPLLLLSSCAPLDWIKGKRATAAPTTGVEEVVVGKDDVVLARVGGKPVVTAQSLDDQFRQLLEDNPQYKQLAEDPQYKEVLVELKENFFRTLVDSKVVARYVKEQGIDARPEYLKKRERILFAVETMLNSEFFEKEFPVTVSDSEVRAFYDEHKNDLVISRGGFATLGVQFDKEADARAFLNKVGGKLAEFRKIAESSGLKDKVRDFKLVHNQTAPSIIDAALRTEITSLKKVPAAKVVVAGDKSVWVIYVSAKEEPKYRTFEEVKEQVKRTIEQKKKMEKVQQELEAIKKKMNVEINEDFFKSQKAKPEEAPEAATAHNEQAGAAVASAPRAA